MAGLGGPSYMNARKLFGKERAPLTLGKDSIGY